MVTDTVGRQKTDMRNGQEILGCMRKAEGVMIKRGQSVTEILQRRPQAWRKTVQEAEDAIRQRQDKEEILTENIHVRVGGGWIR